jgi:hypothetical protein
MSPRKNRKSLDDALARQFIYGGKQDESERELKEEETPSEPPKQQSSPSKSESVAARNAAGTPLGLAEKTPKSSLLIDRFQTPPKEATVRFTVDLPASMHRKLSLFAARTGKKKAEIVRVLLNEALERVND